MDNSITKRNDPSAPLRIGIITDTHYARGRRFEGTRLSDLSLKKIRAIYQALPPVDALFNLGDLINAVENEAENERNICEALTLLNTLDVPCYHVLGNHDCEAATKNVFIKVEEWGGCYAFELKGVRFIVLDANYTSRSESYDNAEWDWKDAWIPEAQQGWLTGELAKSSPAVVLCHQNLDDRGHDPHLVGNAALIRTILETSGNVLCVLQGHYHKGCFTECGGIPYYTFRALCEGNKASYAIMEIKDGHLSIKEEELVHLFSFDVS